MFGIYGSVWTDIVKHKPPWTLTKVMDCWLKHWIAVFIDELDRRAQSQLILLKDICEGSHINSKQLEKEVLKFYEFLVKFKPFIEFPSVNYSYEETDITSSSYACLSIEQNAGSILPEVNNNEAGRENETDLQGESTKNAIICTGKRIVYCV